MNQQRTKYTPEYRREAANLVIESQRPIAHVAQGDRCFRRAFRPVGKKMSANAEEHQMG